MVRVDVNRRCSFEVGPPVSSIMAWKVAGALVNPKGMTKYSKSSYRVRKAVFYSSPFFIFMRWKSYFRFRVVNYLVF